ncbi:MAG: hypothetical protein LUD68_02980 [Rikenellaceae bacterium]|nr:hypothetical protein [Rikenellaceae bacterium]
MNKNSLALLLIAILIHFSSFAQHVRISGHIDGWANDTLVIRYADQITDQWGEDYLLARNGTFSYDIAIENLTHITISSKKDILFLSPDQYYPPDITSVTLLIFPDELLNVTGRHTGDRLDYLVSGSELMKNFSQYWKDHQSLYMVIDSINIAIAKGFVSSASEELEQLFEQRKKIRQSIEKVNGEYIRNHPEHELSGFLIYAIHMDSVPEHYSLLSERIKQGRLKDLLSRCLDTYEQYTIYLKNREFLHQPSPDFTLADINEQPFTLSSLNTQNKYTVIDF